MQIPTNIEPESAAFLQAVGIAATMYNPYELAEWLISPQPLLANKTPLELLAEGGAHDLFGAMRMLDESAYT